MKTISLKVLLGLVTGLVVGLFVPTAGASVIHFTATLNGANESPANLSPATGFVTVDLDNVANTLFVSSTFSGLTGVTSAAHIHCCTAVAGTGTAGVATTVPSFAGFPLGVTAGTFSMTYDLQMASSYNPAFVTANGGTLAGAQAALVAGMLAGRTYFNIHTSAFPGGEIRGFLAPSAVPEPTPLALVTIGLVGAVLLRRRRPGVRPGH